MTKTINLDVYAQEAWSNSLKNELKNIYNTKELKHIYHSYESLFDYFMFSTIDRALLDIKGLERCKTNKISLQFEPDNSEITTLNIYSKDHPVELSQSLEILKSMGLKVLIEKPKQLELDNQTFWIHRYQVNHELCTRFDIDEQTNQQFEELYLRCWHGNYAIDAFNLLLLSAQLNASQIQIFRAYAAYSKQIKSPYSAQYMAEALMQNPTICHLLVQQFDQRFNPKYSKKQISLEENLDELLKEVSSIDHDIIIRTYFDLIMATCRTNFYQKDEDNLQICSFKIIPSNISNIPKPIPAYEIFVYNNRFEGVHLRGGKVARGGIRWSNRLEDYRTEVLGLMKAQMVKNAVIVPTGSKGGFVCKTLTANQSREQQMEEVEQCYRLYIASLLTITDNLINGVNSHPKRTNILDEEDNYLVVAADKGTASYSDIANEIAQKNNFWLDDAFASGGSVGYDHKKMGITARGAWESVKRHFRVLNIDCQQQDFTVIGIGDMSGDVFGNGMLLSKHIQLVAAFNHLHIFIDPNPDSAKSYQERHRLFHLPRSNWSDYDKSLLSQGGGVFSRSSKKIELNPEIKSFLGVQKSTMTPNELIHCILKAKADLLWNGGIGTYIKAESESHLDAQDKANDAIRIDANELKVKMMGEGGNLGITQLGRIQFAQLGGDIYSDAIDNSAGVDCSDHEVNIKILLQQIVLNKQLTEQQRNQLLEDMTDNVAELTLQNNIKQTQIIDMIAHSAVESCYEHARFISHLENDKVLSRKLEELPSSEQLTERMNTAKGLTKPEIAVLLSYSKLVFKQALIDADCFNNKYFERVLIEYFPTAIKNNYQDYILKHPLKNDIIATQLSNQIVNQLGIGYGFKMQEETGGNIVKIIQAYLTVIELFNINKLWHDIETIQKIPENLRYRCLQTISGLIQRSISWLLRSYPNQFDMEVIISRFQMPINKLKLNIQTLLSGDTRKEYNELKRLLKKHKIEDQLTSDLSAVIPLSSAFDISQISNDLNSSVNKTAKLFYSVAKKLDLQWIKQNISRLKKTNHWQQLAIASMRNEIHRHQKKITFHLLNNSTNKHHIQRALDNWEQTEHFALVRYQEKITAIKNARNLDYSMLIVAVNELRILTHQLSSDEHY